MARLVVLILTHNEAMHIGRAIDSVSPFADAVVIVDSGSKDGTVDIARQKGALIVEHPWVNYAQQFQWGLDNLPVAADWIMRLDADEVIEPDLATRIKAELPQLPSDVVGINIKRKHIFMGRWIRHGGRYPLVLLRIWRKGNGRIENRWMDEHIVVWGGRTITMDGGFADHNLNDLAFFTDKHNKYATREAIDILNQRLGFIARDQALSKESASFQASFKRFIKEKIYNRLPFTITTPLYFLFRYILQRGFLDGREGLIYHGLQGFWYRFLVGAKVMELERGISGLTDRQAIAERLQALTGLKLG